MNRVDRLVEMEKLAAPGAWQAFKTMKIPAAIGRGYQAFRHNPVARTVGSGAMGGLSVLFGSMMGGGAAENISDLAYKGPMGVGAREKWLHEQREARRKMFTPEEQQQGRTHLRRGGLIGAGVGALGGAFAMMKGKPLLGLAAPILGWSTGRNIAKAVSPAADESPDPIDATLGQYRGLMSDRQARAWTNMLQSPEMMANPQARAALVNQFHEHMQGDPAVAAYQKRQRTAKRIGGAIGGLGLGALMLFGKKKGLRPDATRLQKLIGGSTLPGFAGLVFGGTALGALATREGGRRAGLEDYRKRALEQALDEGGMSAAFYGMGWSPNIRKLLRR